MRHSTILAWALALAVLPALAESAAAQDRAQVERDRARDRARVLVRAAAGDEDRPVLGITTSSSGERDTLGLLVVSVTPDGPADKAGIEEGNRIAAVNGTNLRLSAVDAGERDMQGMTTRRLVRELGKVEPGAEVELRVWQNGSYRNVKVKTVAAADLPGRRRLSRDDFEQRGVLGLQLGGGASRRDTLGVLVVGVTSDGPAEKAGIVEGDRIVAIGDVDLRVPAADAGDRWVTSTRVNRFMRELRDLEPGKSVTLRVRSGGETRTVTVTAVAAKDLADEEHGVYIFGDAVGMGVLPAVPPMAPVPPMPPSFQYAPRVLRVPAPARAPRAEGRVILDLDALDDVELVMPDVELYIDDVWSAEAATAAAKAAAKATKARAKQLEQTRERLEVEREALEARERTIREQEARLRAVAPVRSASWSYTDAAAPAVVAAPAMARTASTLTLPGLTLSLVNAELASYFGPGAERGLLVLAADARWDGLREGDVILAVDGKTTSGFACVTSLAKGDRALVVLRGGKRTQMTVNGKA